MCVRRTVQHEGRECEGKLAPVCDSCSSGAAASVVVVPFTAAAAAAASLAVSLALSFPSPRVLSFARCSSIMIRSSSIGNRERSRLLLSSAEQSACKRERERKGGRAVPHPATNTRRQRRRRRLIRRIKRRNNVFVTASLVSRPHRKQSHTSTGAGEGKVILAF